MTSGLRDHDPIEPYRYTSRMRVAPDSHTIDRVVCKVGDGGAGGRHMTRRPYGSSSVSKLLFEVTERPQKIAWAFTVERQ